MHCDNQTIHTSIRQRQNYQREEGRRGSSRHQQVTVVAESGLADAPGKKLRAKNYPEKTSILRHTKINL